MMRMNFDTGTETKGQHVKNTKSAERSRVPLLHIPLQCRLHRICKFTDDGNSPSVAREVPFLVSIHGLLKSEESQDEDEGSISPGGSIRGGG
jgi:hypothetical protein